MYGETFTSQICNPYTGEPSAAQQAQQTRMATASAKVKALTPEQRTAYKEEFKKQTKYKSLHGYMMAQEYAKLVWNQLQFRGDENSIAETPRLIA